MKNKMPKPFKGFKVRIRTVEGDTCHYIVQRNEGLVFIFKRIIAEDFPGPGWEIIRQGKGYCVSEQFLCFREETFDIIQKELAS